MRNDIGQDNLATWVLTIGFVLFGGIGIAWGLISLYDMIRVMI